MTVFEMWQHYGPSAGEPFYGPRWGDSFHYGLDMPTPVGVDIHSHMDAKVRLMGFYDSNKSGYICLEALDGSHCWLVAHVSQVNTAKPIGSIVKAGEWVGKTGNTGNATGAHAHWEYYVGSYTNNITWMQENGRTRDPLPFLKGGQTDMNWEDILADWFDVMASDPHYAETQPEVFQNHIKYVSTLPWDKRRAWYKQTMADYGVLNAVQMKEHLAKDSQVLIEKEAINTELAGINQELRTTIDKKNREITALQKQINDMQPSNPPSSPENPPNDPEPVKPKTNIIQEIVDLLRELFKGVK